MPNATERAILVTVADLDSYSGGGRAYKVRKSEKAYPGKFFEVPRPDIAQKLFKSLKSKVFGVYCASKIFTIIYKNMNNNTYVYRVSRNYIAIFYQPHLCLKIRQKLHIQECRKVNRFHVTGCFRIPIEDGFW